MKRNISDYLPAPEKQHEKALLQAQVDKTLKRQLVKILRAQRLTVIQFMEASMRKFIDENRGTHLT